MKTSLYKSVEDIERLVAEFEAATISRDAWKHAEHMIVAMHYLEKHDLDTATDKMRAGIFNLLTKGFGVDLSKEMPYHETLTIFWMRTVYAFSLLNKDMPTIEKANSLIETFNKDYPLTFYSREVLFSDEARSRFIGPDIEDQPG